MAEKFSVNVEQSLPTFSEPNKGDKISSDDLIDQSQKHLKIGYERNDI